MTDDRPGILTELDSLGVGPAPVGAIVRAGRTARRRRATVAAVAALTVLIGGGGVVATQLLGGDDTSDSLATDGRTVTTPHPPGLAVIVEPLYPHELADELRPGTAEWDATTRAVSYITVGAFSTTCPPTGSASRDDGGLRLVLTSPVTDDVDCPADVRVVDATITGLTEPPTELTITENGHRRTIDVTTPASDPTRVDLEVGHCFTEPLTIDGQTWVTVDDIGYGGELPSGFSEQGEFVVLGPTRARFDADLGARVPFKPAPAEPVLRPCR